MHSAKPNLVWELHAADILILDIEVQRSLNTSVNRFKGPTGSRLRENRQPSSESVV
jgi:hypothetical protein